MNTPRCLMLLCCSLVFAAVDARAEEWTMGVHTVSVHIPGHDGQNNLNGGIYARSPDGWTLGGYLNTQEKLSIYGGYTFKVGPIDVLLGVVSGYQESCQTETVVTGTHKHSQERADGSTVVTTGPTYGQEESCTGFSRGAIVPMLAPSYALPFKVMGATPRIWFMPSVGKSDSVIHLSLEAKF